MADILVPPSPNVKLNDKIIQQLLNKLDQVKRKRLKQKYNRY